jgi:hypothetical protein
LQIKNGVPNQELIIPQKHVGFDATESTVESILQRSLVSIIVMGMSMTKRSDVRFYVLGLLA